MRILSSIRLRNLFYPQRPSIKQFSLLQAGQLLRNCLLKCVQHLHNDTCFIIYFAFSLSLKRSLIVRETFFRLSHVPDFHQVARSLHSLTPLSYRWRGLFPLHRTAHFCDTFNLSRIY